MADILDGLNSITPKDIDFEQRVNTKVKSLRDGSKQLLLGFAAQRNQLVNLLFADPNTPPQSVLNRMEPGEAYSLFNRDKKLAAFLVDQFASAGVPAETITVLVRGIPDQYDVTIDDEKQTVIIKVK